MSTDIRRLATHIVQVLADAGFPTYFAGGWVRDYLLGHEDLGDIDIATAARPEEVTALFENTHPVGAQFGVVLVVLEGHAFEVASFRKDGLYVDGRRPQDVTYATADEDAHRRDFTINGMFYDPATETVLDFVEGRRDLEAGIVRAIGNPLDRFHEDRLRILRAVRVAARFGFKIEAQTAAAISEYAPQLFPSVAVERVWAELEKMASNPGFETCMDQLWRFGILDTLFPELREMSPSMVQKGFERVSGCEAHVPVELRFALYGLHLSIQEMVQLLERYKVSRSTLRRIERWYAGRELLLEGKGNVLDLVRFYALDEVELLLHLLSLLTDDSKAFLQACRAQMELYADAINRARSNRYLLDAGGLKAAGISPGPIMGLLLERAEIIAIERNCGTADQVLQHLKNDPQWPQEA